MPDPAWVAVGGTLAINAGLAFYVAGTVKEQVRALMEWRDDDAKPMLAEHDRQIARLHMCPLMHQSRPHGHEAP